MKTLVKLSQAQLSNLQSALVSLVTAGASIALAFGAFSGTTERVVISAAGIIIAALIQVYAIFES
jgi:hypothetical protein